ncbi:zinc finger, CCHC-type containing protein [Tanacetum coccineum]
MSPLMLFTQHSLITYLLYSGLMNKQQKQNINLYLHELNIASKSTSVVVVYLCVLDDAASLPRHSIDLNGSTRKTTRLNLFCFSLRDQAINWLDCLPAGSILTWDDLTTRFLAQFFPPGRIAKLRKDILMFQQLQIFYDHVDYTTEMAIDYAVGGRLRKLRPEESWETIKDLSQHEEEEWNDPIFSEKGSLDCIDATLKREFKSMECRVESLTRNEVLLEYEIGFTFPKRPYQEELEARILN